MSFVTADCARCVPHVSCLQCREIPSVGFPDPLFLALPLRAKKKLCPYCVVMASSPSSTRLHRTITLRSFSSSVGDAYHRIDALEQSNISSSNSPQGQHDSRQLLCRPQVKELLSQARHRETIETSRRMNAPASSDSLSSSCEELRQDR